MIRGFRVKNLFTLHFFQVADYFKEQQGKE